MTHQTVEGQRAVLMAWAHRFYIDRREELYRRTGNPVHAWRAYRWARYLRVPIPEWVLTVQDTIARAPDAPLLSSAGGPTAESQADTDERDLHVILRVKVLCDRGLSVTRAIERTAEEHGRSEPTIREIYYSRFRDSHDPL